MCLEQRKIRPGQFAERIRTPKGAEPGSDPGLKELWTASAANVDPKVEGTGFLLQPNLCQVEYAPGFGASRKNDDTVNFG